LTHWLIAHDSCDSCSPSSLCVYVHLLFNTHFNLKSNLLNFTYFGGCFLEFIVNSSRFVVWAICKQRFPWIGACEIEWQFYCLYRKWIKTHSSSSVRFHAKKKTTKLRSQRRIQCFLKREEIENLKHWVIIHIYLQNAKIKFDSWMRLWILNNILV